MPYVSDLLTAAAASVTGTPTPTRTWQWLRDGIAISGATSATYTVDPADEGSQISVRQIESNFVGADTATSVATSVVLAFNPIALFASGEEGAWYDPSDMSTMFQDVAGTTPVTAAGQPVGLILDKSKGLTLGAELITTAPNNGTTYSFDTYTTDGLLITAASTNTSKLAGAYWDLGSLLPANTWVKLTITVSVSPGSLVPKIVFVGNQTGAGGYLSNVHTLTTGTHTVFLKTTGSTRYLQIGTGNGLFDFSVSSISAKELPGNHATQSTSAARPVLQTSGGLWYLDFDGADDWMRATFASNQLQPNTIAAAFKFDQGSRLEFLMDGIGSYRNTIYKVSTKLGLYAGLGIFDPTNAGTIEHVAVGHLNTTSSDLRVDGTSVITGNTGSSQWNGVTLGANASTPASAFVDGRIYSFVGVNRTLTAGEIDALESYLATKSGVTLP